MTEIAAGYLLTHIYCMPQGQIELTIASVDVVNSFIFYEFLMVLNSYNPFIYKRQQ